MFCADGCADLRFHESGNAIIIEIQNILFLAMHLPIQIFLVLSFD